MSYLKLCAKVSVFCNLFIQLNNAPLNIQQYIFIKLKFLIHPTTPSLTEKWL